MCAQFTFWKPNTYNKQECQFLSPFPEVTRMSMSTVSFLTQLHSEILCLQNTLLQTMILVALSLELTDIF